MNYHLLKEAIQLLEDFETEQKAFSTSETSIQDFKKWIVSNFNAQTNVDEPHWEGKEHGRSPESVISTLIVHMNRYAKSYSKSAIFGSDFSSQEDFIYLINLKAFGEMTKMELIKKNVHEKPVGMQIINRLIAKGWIDQADSETDKRSKLIAINRKGMEILDRQMDNIREATKIVTGDLTHAEKMELIRLLNKLNDFHQPIYNKNIDTEHLLQEVLQNRN